jgi:hypothetical protein
MRVIRGSIEMVQPDRVAGWIYCSADVVHDKLILAFVGARCVGAGKVDRFRQDLLDAKLDNGFCGFDFPIDLAPGENLGAVVVKLQNADAALIQHSSRLIGPDDEADTGACDLGAITPSSVAWMQDRGWLEQQEYDFLKAVQGIGAYERGLRPPRRVGGDAPAPLKPDAVAHDLLSLFVLGDVDITTTSITSLSDLAPENLPSGAGAVSVFALCSTERSRICLDERSHLGPKAGRGKILAAPPAGGIDYSFGPDRVLFLHRDCSFAPQGYSPSGGITLLTATQRATRENGKTGSQSKAA